MLIQYCNIGACNIRWCTPKIKVVLYITEVQFLYGKQYFKLNLLKLAKYLIVTNVLLLTLLNSIRRQRHVS